MEFRIGSKVLYCPAWGTSYVPATIVGVREVSGRLDRIFGGRTVYKLSVNGDAPFATNADTLKGI